MKEMLMERDLVKILFPCIFIDLIIHIMPLPFVALIKLLFLSTLHTDTHSFSNKYLSSAPLNNMPICLSPKKDNGVIK